ncbi:hypothetical protein IE53DRAFT_361735 [Violaceomyces palustris]|uniref:Uncharacterized protein n=1 Tax=Violaceomyces palustris TaxID=1673888 RepID=A0ACD0NZH2_9BASI|nr:hypothetical protein IE53DRAFT_361735 [Violaceomyces palustris]
MVAAQLLVLFFFARTLFLSLVSAAYWSDTLNSAKLLGLPIDHLDAKKYPIKLEVRDLTKEEVECAEAWIHAHHKHGTQNKTSHRLTAPKVASLNMGAPNPHLGINENPLVYTYINLHYQGSDSDEPLLVSDKMEVKLSKPFANLRLTGVEFRGMAGNSRSAMYNNPFSNQLLQLMRGNTQILKLEAKMIYRLTEGDPELWYDFSKRGKIILNKIDPMLSYSYGLVRKNYPFIESGSSEEKEEESGSFDFEKDGDKVILDFNEWFKNQGSSSHS